jgi:uncharacterized protein DUF4340
MKSVVVHATLLVAALLTAFVTWTRGDSPARDDASIRIWNRSPAEVTAVVFQAGDRSLELQRRVSGNIAHVWTKETLPEPPAPPPPPTDSAARDSAKAQTPAPPRLRTDEYPAGKRSDAIFESLARMRVERDLGAVDAKKRTEYGLDKSDAKLTIRFRDRTQRAFSLGNTVVGGGGRYALDGSANRVYVLSSDMLRSLEPGSGELRLTELHAFEPSRLAAVTIHAGGGQRRMQRRTSTTPPQNIWTQPGSEQPDQAFTNFMEQLNQLWISRFAVDVSADSLETVLRVEYFDDDGDRIGSLDLFRTRTAPRVYYMRTPRTIVPGEIYAPLGERIEQDVATVFRSGRGVQRS